jgi:hypothetical protein
LDCRPELDALLDYLRPGDVLVVWRLDRLGRSVRHPTETVNALAERGVGFRSLTEGVDTTTAAGKRCSISSPRWLIRAGNHPRAHHRGLAAARAHGRKGGRRPKLAISRRQGQDGC